MTRILFVHNAHSGKKNMLVDGLHKAISPSTYQCQLCALTYGTFTVKKQWTKFIESLDEETEFMYKDQFDKQFPGNPFETPAIFIDNGKQLEEKVSAKKFKEIKDLDELIQIVKDLN